MTRAAGYAAEEVVLERVAHGAGSVGYPELAIDVGQVELDRVLADPQVVTYRGGGHAGRHG